jgi:hypothetical protein
MTQPSFGYRRQSFQAIERERGAEWVAYLPRAIPQRNRMLDREDERAASSPWAGALRCRGGCITVVVEWGHPADGFRCLLVKIVAWLVSLLVQASGAYHTQPRRDVDGESIVGGLRGGIGITVAQLYARCDDSGLVRTACDGGGL